MLFPNLNRGDVLWLDPARLKLYSSFKRRIHYFPANHSPAALLKA